MVKKKVNEFELCVDEVGAIKVMHTCYPDNKFEQRFVNPNGDANELCKKFQKLKNGQFIKITFLDKVRGKK